MKKYEYTNFDNINCIKRIRNKNNKFITEYVHVFVEKYDLLTFMNSLNRNKLHPNNVKIETVIKALAMFKELNNFKNIRKSLNLKRETFQKLFDDLSDDRKMISKTDKFFKGLTCPHCGAYKPLVTILSIKNKISVLNKYRNCRRIIVNQKIKNKHKDWIKYINRNSNEYDKLCNENSKNSLRTFCQKSVRTLIDEAKEKGLNIKFPHFTTIYRNINILIFDINISILPNKSIGKGERHKKDPSIPKKRRVGLHISLRPEITTMFDFEFDTVHGKSDDLYHIAVLINRATRKFYMRLCERDADSTKEALIHMIDEHELNINTLTIDNGSENYTLDQINTIKQIYHCDAFNSSQKGRIENCNKMIRKYRPKSITFDNLTHEWIEIINEKINNFVRHEVDDFPFAMSANQFEKFIQENKHLYPSFHTNLYA